MTPLSDEDKYSTIFFDSIKIIMKPKIPFVTVVEIEYVKNKLELIKYVISDKESAILVD